MEGEAVAVWGGLHGNILHCKFAAFTLASLRATEQWLRRYRSGDGLANGYYLVDGADRGGGWDLELREYAGGGAGGNHARHRYADRV